MNPLAESETDKMILIKDMVHCFLLVGTLSDNSSECGLYERCIRSRLDNCAQLVLNDLMILFRGNVTMFT